MGRKSTNKIDIKFGYGCTIYKNINSVKALYSEELFDNSKKLIKTIESQVK